MTASGRGRWRRTASTPRAPAALAGLALALAAACSGFQGPVEDIPADDPRLDGASESPDGIWESQPWSDPSLPWIEFPPRTTVGLEHGLGRTPRVVLVYLSFDAEGTRAALASGDLALTIDIDEQWVRILNDTNAVFFFRVVLE